MEEFFLHDKCERCIHKRISKYLASRSFEGHLYVPRHRLQGYLKVISMYPDTDFKVIWRSSLCTQTPTSRLFEGHLYVPRHRLLGYLKAISMYPGHRLQGYFKVISMYPDTDFKVTWRSSLCSPDTDFKVIWRSSLCNQTLTSRLFEGHLYVPRHRLHLYVPRHRRTDIDAQPPIYPRLVLYT